MYPFQLTAHSDNISMYITLCLDVVVFEEMSLFSEFIQSENLQIRKKIASQKEQGRSTRMHHFTVYIYSLLTKIQ